MRDAIAQTCTEGTVTFAPGVTGAINLTSGELSIHIAMTITGPGANLMTVPRSASAITNFSIFHITAGGTVNISGLTITKGNPNHVGGGIYVDNSSALFLADCAVTDNTAQRVLGVTQDGGGIANATSGISSVTIVRSTISGNLATRDGGGIAADRLTLDTSTISGNTAGRFGGGISAVGTTSIANSTVANNSAVSGGGLRGNGYS